jgi:hypothetical protein
MAKVKIEDVVDELSAEMQNVLYAAVKEILPDAEF